jgi:hypothetical protein
MRRSIVDHEDVSLMILMGKQVPSNPPPLPPKHKKVVLEWHLSVPC